MMIRSKASRAIWSFTQPASGRCAEVTRPIFRHANRASSRWHRARHAVSLSIDSAILTAAVVFLLAVASIYQYLMGVSGVPQMLGDVLGPLKAHPRLFLIGPAAMTCIFGMVLEGLPAAVVLIPVVVPISEAM